MNFLQRIGNALSRFMYGRNGVDKLGLTMLWAAIRYRRGISPLKGEMRRTEI